MTIEIRANVSVHAHLRRIKRLNNEYIYFITAHSEVESLHADTVQFSFFFFAALSFGCWCRWCICFGFYALIALASTMSDNMCFNCSFKFIVLDGRHRFFSLFLSLFELYACPSGELFGNRTRTHTLARAASFCIHFALFTITSMLDMQIIISLQ